MSELIKKEIIDFLKKHRQAQYSQILNAVSADEIEVLNALLELEYEHVVKRLGGPDPSSPLTSSTWTIIAPRLEEKSSHHVEEQEKNALIIVSSMPSFLRDKLRILYKELGIISYEEALFYIAKKSTEKLRIISPFVDDLILFILHKTHAKRIYLLTEEQNSVIEKALKIFPLEVRLIHERDEKAGKISGIHAKVLIADLKLALIGSANIRYNHFIFNLDVGLMIYHRKIVERLVRLFDFLWAEAKPYNDL